ncbi:MAG: hypothetical protein DWQ31_04785 [Planctomycetota bacterium]|nr:MAG: hypothetical protein DWQ31_04785 [Planctomycetota bacterium]
MDLNLSISLTCFTASYAVALVLEISRLFFRSGIRGAVMLLFGFAGLVAHSWYLAALALTSPAGGVPLSSLFALFLIAAWLLAAMYLYLTYRNTRHSIGLFMLPVVLGLIGVAYAFADDVAPNQADALWLWLVVHIVCLMLATVTVSVGLIAGVMYLVAAWQLKHKSPESGIRLPSLEWCEKVNARSLTISTIWLALGMAAGLLRNLGLWYGDSTGGVTWSDPVVWSTGLLMVWLITATVFRALYRPARQGRKVAYLTVISFVLLALVVSIELMMPAAHATRPASVPATAPENPA